ncbi:hypothetical protein HPB51_003155 [Rhipicephalus microplus]|uniref:Phospholipase A-2-activating protein n=1 Tax=Rhipicephalus microplus TaxID=6941 RepID=A0A9J6EL80_RHIMP|nr:hypothetical protein HPB51_003155 [Rhipicephalus microplus]
MEFLSTSNDQTIRHWTATGECLRVYAGHGNYIYSICALPDSPGGTEEFVTGGEDRTVRVWACGGDCIQTISFPAHSVWSVACLANGDIIAGTSDGVARVFTRHKELQAPPEEQAAFAEAVAKFALPAQEIGDLKINELPGKEALFEKGHRDGHTRLIREGDLVSAYQWVAADNTWQKIGDVVGTPNADAPAGKIMYEGKEYDYVFDVDLDTGGKMKLPYNVTEDPWHAAQKFIHRHELNQYYLDQIANFIIQNTKGMVAQGIFQELQRSPSLRNKHHGNQQRKPMRKISTSPGRCGLNCAGVFGMHFQYSSNASEWSPKGCCTSPGSRETAGERVHLDAFLTLGAAERGEHMAGDSTDVDNAAGDMTVGGHFFPHTSFVRFDIANIQGIQTKLQEFNTQVPPAHTVDDNDLASLIELATSTSAVPGDAQLGALDRVVHWPEDYVFPALDLLRLALRIQAVNSRVCQMSGAQLCSLLIGLLSSTGRNAAANQMLVLRCLCNLFSQPSGEALALQERERILGALQRRAGAGGANKNTQIAMSTLLLNFAVAHLREGAVCDPQATERMVQLLTTMVAVAAELTDGEAQFRLLVAAGTLCNVEGTGTAEIRDLAVALELPQIVEKWVATDCPVKVKLCAQQFLESLR